MKETGRTYPKPKIYLIKNIGGRLEKDYCSLKAAVDEMNAAFFDLLCYFNLNRSDDPENVAKALSEGVLGIGQYFVSRTLKDIEEGKLKKEKVLKEKWIVNENTPSEERELRLKKETTELRRTLTLKFKQALKEYEKQNEINCFELNSYYKAIISQSLFNNLFYITDYGVEIDTKEFIIFYKDRMAASESVIGELHEEAAKALNNFFGGAVPVTEDEIKRYFDLKDGIVKVKQESITMESYCRLGNRIKTNKNGKKKHTKTLYTSAM